MVDILVRNIDDSTAARLRSKAKADGKSVNETVRDAISAYVKPSKAQLLEAAARLRAMSPRSDTDSTALIREDRDNDEPYR